MGDCGGGSMEQVLTSLQTGESNSARLNSGVDQVFQDFRVRTSEPSVRQVVADFLNELAIEMKTDIETIRVYGKSSLTTATCAINELTDSVSKQVSDALN
ncbi:hypothetical protein OC846_006267 [Tilletia horrida]|uniref:Uncharacterized protein n=1 Tax=Tilletia horrida TaxID=155126 RepID=A0AAN6JQU3_9BASI|nr:hypothetical protein OC845_006548 [Tilletia horrida]KAK0543854.1 hypothetical protein OC846_006267 [Tilletia horrida]